MRLAASVWSRVREMHWYRSLRNSQRAREALTDRIATSKRKRVRGF